MLGALKKKGPSVSGGYSGLLRAAAVPLTRARIRRALAALDIELPYSGGRTTYCGEASAILVMAIEMDAGIELETRTRDQALNSIFFMLVIASRLAELLDANFEQASLTGSLEFIDSRDELPEFLARATTLFNQQSAAKGIVKSVCEVFDCWLHYPENEYYQTLVDMYKTSGAFARF